MTGQDHDKSDQFSHSEGGSVPSTKRRHPEDSRAANPIEFASTGGPKVVRTHGDKSMARVVYILYFLGLVFNFFAPVGFVIALSYRDQAQGTWVATHYQFQIRTFWIGAGIILAAFTVMAFGAILLGWMTLVFWLIWALARTLRGWKLLALGKPVPDPETFGW